MTSLVNYIDVQYFRGTQSIGGQNLISYDELITCGQMKKKSKSAELDLVKNRT